MQITTAAAQLATTSVRLPKNPPCPKPPYLGIAESLQIRLPKSLAGPPQKQLFLGKVIHNS